MLKHKVILLDDEDGNNRLLKHFIENYCPDLEVVAECKDIQSAYKEIIQHESLIIFLDIELGNHQNGFELIELINKRNDQVIIVSAFPEYAIQAFRYETTDFLMKPIKIAELVEAATRAVKGILLPKSNSQQDSAELFAIQLYTKTQFVKQESIHYLEANFSNTIVHMEDGAIFESTERIGEIELRLNNSLFFRTHKTYVINIKFVTSINSEGTKCTIEMDNGELIPLARRRKKLALERFYA